MRPRTIIALTLAIPLAVVAAQDASLGGGGSGPFGPRVPFHEVRLPTPGVAYSLSQVELLPWVDTEVVVRDLPADPEWAAEDKVPESGFVHFNGAVYLLHPAPDGSLRASLPASEWRVGSGLANDLTVTSFAADGTKLGSAGFEGLLLD